MFWLEEAGLPMTGANIARAMQLSPPTVHEMIGRLIDDGYVERNPNKSLAFTESGREHASYIVRRHRMIERFLTDVLGIPWDEVHEEAERIEHAMSPGAGGADAGGDRRRHHLPPRPPDRRGHPRAGLAAGRRRGRRRRHRPALRERGRGAAPLPQGRRASTRAWRARSRAPTTSASSSPPPTAATRSAAASPRPSRSAPTRRRRRGRRSPSSWCFPATATAGERSRVAAYSRVNSLLRY